MPVMTDFEEIVRQLERLDSGYLRFLTISTPTRELTIADIIEPHPYDPRPGMHDVFAGRLLTVGWQTWQGHPDMEKQVALELRLQLVGVQTWPTDPVAVLWKPESGPVGGVLLLDATEVGETHTYVGRGDDRGCTTIKISTPTARLLEEGPS